MTATLRLRASAATLALLVGLGTPLEAWAASQVPLPKPRPIARNATPGGADKLRGPLPIASSAAPVLEPATRQHALPAVKPARKPQAPAALAATSSTPQADVDALENVIELIRKRKPGDASAGRPPRSPIRWRASSRNG